MMIKKKKDWIVKIAIISLVSVGLVSIVYSYSKSTVKSRDAMVVTDKLKITVSKDEDKPLQVVKTEKIDTIEGLNAMKNLEGDNEVIVQIGMSRKEIEEGYKKLDKDNNEQKIKFREEIRGGKYKLNLTTLQKEPFNLPQDSIISPDKTKYAYEIKDKDDNNSFYIYDLKTKSSKKVDLKSKFLWEWSQNNKYLLGLNWGDNPGIVSYDIQNGKSKEVKVDSKRFNILFGVYSNDGENIYFTASNRERKNNKFTLTDELYKLNINNEKTEKIMSLPPSEGDLCQNRILKSDFRIIDEGKKVIFQGNLNGENGLFSYNVKDKKFNKIAQSVGNSFVPFSISPDENKIIYATYNGEGDKGSWTIYAAKIKDNELVDKILLLKDIDYYTMIERKSVQWSNDSNKAIIFECKTFDFNNIAIPEKGIIHSIYFK